MKESFDDIADAYTNAATRNQDARRSQLSNALQRLLWRGSKKTPRRLRPWALLSVQSLVAEILRKSPRQAAEFGVTALLGHPQCFPSLGRRLERI